MTDASYLGVSTQYVVDTRGGARVVVYEQNIERATKSDLWERGDEVHLTWSPDHTFVVDTSWRAGRGRRGLAQRIWRRSPRWIAMH